MTNWHINKLPLFPGPHKISVNDMRFEAKTEFLAAVENTLKMDKTVFNGSIQIIHEREGKTYSSCSQVKQPRNFQSTRVENTERSILGLFFQYTRSDRKVRRLLLENINVTQHIWHFLYV